MQPVAVHATGGHRLSCGYTMPVEIRVLGRDKRVLELGNRILERGDFQSSIGVIRLGLDAGLRCGPGLGNEELKLSDLHDRWCVIEI